MSDFQRRHYVKLAEFWNFELLCARGTANEHWSRTAYKNFKLKLMEDNSNFKESVFDKASGYTD